MSDEKSLVTCYIAKADVENIRKLDLTFGAETISKLRYETKCKFSDLKELFDLCKNSINIMQHRYGNLIEYIISMDDVDLLIKVINAIHNSKSNVTFSLSQFDDMICLANGNSIFQYHVSTLNSYSEYIRLMSHIIDAPNDNFDKLKFFCEYDKVKDIVIKYMKTYQTDNNISKINSSIIPCIDNNYYRKLNYLLKFIDGNIESKDYYEQYVIYAAVMSRLECADLLLSYCDPNANSNVVEKSIDMIFDICSWPFAVDNIQQIEYLHDVYTKELMIFPSHIIIRILLCSIGDRNKMLFQYLITAFPVICATLCDREIFAKYHNIRVFRPYCLALLEVKEELKEIEEDIMKT